MDTIVAPLFPRGLAWVNAPGGQASIIQRGRPLLVEFWDFCRANSLRTLPYVKEWHARYGPAGLRTIGVHCPGFDPSRPERAVRDAVSRLGISYPVAIDSALEVWQDYGNEGWPSRYLFDGRARLVEYHHGEGGYLETELAIQELVGIEREPMAPLRPRTFPARGCEPRPRTSPARTRGHTRRAACGRSSTVKERRGSAAAPAAAPSWRSPTRAHIP